jgi:hypothetical protein
MRLKRNTWLVLLALGAVVYLHREQQARPA